MSKRNHEANLIKEAKEYYRKEYMGAKHPHWQKVRLRTLPMFDAYQDFVNGMPVWDIADKYGYKTNSYAYEKIKVAKARADMFIKLRGQGRA